MTREEFYETNWKMTFEEYEKINCNNCDKSECAYKGTFRRMPEADGGQGLCPRLSE